MDSRGFHFGSDQHKTFFPRQLILGTLTTFGQENIGTSQPGATAKVDSRPSTRNVAHATGPSPTVRRCRAHDSGAGSFSSTPAKSGLAGVAAGLPALHCRLPRSRQRRFREASHGERSEVLGGG